jgi:DNA-binding MltR family transcriptional regulator
MSTTFEEFIANDSEFKRRYELIAKVGAESERGMAVLVAAELDRALELVLRSYLIAGKAVDNLFDGGTPPLGTFSSKINLARALHLIRRDEFESLQLIRRIRNEFAHNPNARFEDAKIKSWMNELRETEKADPRAAFAVKSAELIVSLEIGAVHEATGRLGEEMYNTFYRRGYDHPDRKPPPDSDVPF